MALSPFVYTVVFVYDSLFKVHFDLIFYLFIRRTGLLRCCDVSINLTHSENAEVAGRGFSGSTWWVSSSCVRSTSSHIKFIINVLVLRNDSVSKACCLNLGSNRVHTAFSIKNNNVDL